MLGKIADLPEGLLVADRMAQHRSLALGGPDDGGQNLNEGTFPGSIRTKETKDGTFGDLELKAPEGFHLAAVDLPDPGKIDNVRRHGLPRR